MNTQAEALRMAIKQMQHLIKIYIPSPEWSGTAIQEDCYEAIRACKEALAQPAQEPVAWMDEEGIWQYEWESHSDNKKPLYTHPAPSWQGLSDDEKLAIIRKWKDANTMREQELIGLGDAIEQALKEKNT